MKACVIGLGERGFGLITYILLKNKDISIVSVCDQYEDRVARAADAIAEAGERPQGFTDYREALNVKGLEMVFVFTGWEMHTEIAVAAMKKGIPVASEVGCEYSLENCFALVRTQEETGTPYMFMENCCWGKEELLGTALVRNGLLGTIVHAAGAYAHDLRSEVAYGLKNRHYRFRNYQHRNCENYPTHELGPIAKVLDINRGNRILTVSSVASKAAGLAEYIAGRDDASAEMKNTTFRQGDIVTTLLTCANGETIRLQLDTTLPRYYSRDFTLRGTKGMYLQDFNCVYLDGDEHVFDPAKHLNNSKPYEEKYLPDCWKNITKEEMDAGHGGMDWFAYKAFTDAVKDHTVMPIDVYDAATWMAVSVLSEQSIAQGGAPQVMPDFTNGRWLHRPRLDVCEL